MWRPKKIILQNLMTHIDTEYEFQNGSCVMVYGKNLTDSGTDSNGTGKSTILEAITLAITGVTSRDVNKDDFINDDSDNTYIQFDLYNHLGVINDLSIRRWYHRKKASKVEIWENGIKNGELTSVNEANSYIYEVIGLSKEDLLHFFIIGQDTNYSFLTASDTEKKNIISRFSNINFIESKIDTLKDNRKELDEEIDTFEKDISKLETKIEVFEEQIEEIRENEEDDKSIRIKKIKQKIKSKKKLQEENLIKQEDKQEKLDELEVSINSMKIKSKKKIDEKIDDVEEKIRTEKKSLRILKQEKDHLSLLSDGKLSCPKCSFEFNPTDDIDVKSIPDKILEKEDEIISYKKKIELLNKKLEKYEKSLELITEKEDEKEELLSDKKRLNRKLNSLTEEHEEISESINKLKKNIKTIKKEKITDKTTTLKENINENKEMMEVLKSGKGEIESELEVIDYWIYHFGKKGFMTYLTNKSVKSIEGVTNSFLQKMNSDLQVIIDGFTELKNGDIREKINVEILRSGMKVGNFKRYSGGEKGRINLANILGLQKLINLTCSTGGLDFLGLDEVFEGLDQSGQRDVLKILENQSVTSLVVTHRNQPMGVDNELFIAKKNGISEIISKKSFKLAH